MSATNDNELLNNNIIMKKKIGNIEYKFSLVDGHVYKFSTLEQTWHWFAGCSKERALDLINKYLSRKHQKYITRKDLEKKEKVA